MTEALKEILKNLAESYEIPSFCNEDPSQFLRWYESDVTAIETASFIAAMLSFGSRKQFINKIKVILELADKTSGDICKWLISKDYETSFPKGEEKFYRFYSYNDMHNFFSDLGILIQNEGKDAWGAFGESVRQRWLKEKANDEDILLADVISLMFPNSKIVPKGKNTANKRIHMFLRWMVRQNSVVDLGLWKWYSSSDLLIPLDVHVMEEGVNLGALPENARATKKTAIALTKSLKEIWPDDPCKGDFALFGLGVNK